MGIIDIVVLVLLILSILIGFFRGFKRKHLYSFASTIGCALGYLAGIPLAHALMGTNLGSTTLTNAYRKTRSDTGIFGEPVALTPSEIKVPSFFQGFAINHVVDISGTVSKALASSFAYRTRILACFILLYLAVMLLSFLLLRPLWNGLFGETGTSLIGRLFGIAYSLAKMCILIIGLRMVLTLINQLMVRFDVTTRNDFIVKDLNLGQSNSFSIGRLFYNTANSFRQWISLIGK